MKYKYLYKYQARNIAIEEIKRSFWTSSLALLTIVFLSFLSDPIQNISIGFLYVLLSLIIIIGAFKFSYGLVKMVSGKEWIIYITKKKLVWKTPYYQMKGFSIHLSDIDNLLIEKVTTLSRNSEQSSPFTEVNYFIVSKKEETIYLDSSSGIDLDELFDELVECGCELKITEISRLNQH